MPELSHPVSTPGCFLALPSLEGLWQLEPGTGMLFLPSQLVSHSSPSIPEKHQQKLMLILCWKIFQRSPPSFPVIGPAKLPQDLGLAWILT